MKKNSKETMQSIVGGTKAPGCGTVGAMTVFTGVGGGISFAYWSTLWNVCWDI